MMFIPYIVPIALAWSLAGVWSYRRVRKYYRARGWLWSVADRRGNIVFGMLGSIAAFASWMVYTPDEKREAKW